MDNQNIGNQNVASQKIGRQHIDSLEFGNHDICNKTIAKQMIDNQEIGKQQIGRQDIVSQHIGNPNILSQTIAGQGGGSHVNLTVNNLAIRKLATKNWQPRIGVSGLLPKKLAANVFAAMGLPHKWQQTHWRQDDWQPAFWHARYLAGAIMATNKLFTPAKG